MPVFELDVVEELGEDPHCEKNNGYGEACL